MPTLILSENAYTYYGFSYFFRCQTLEEGGREMGLRKGERHSQQIPNIKKSRKHEASVCAKVFDNVMRKQDWAHRGKRELEQPLSRSSEVMHISRWGEGKTSSVSPAGEYWGFEKELFQQFKHVRLVAAKAECCWSTSYRQSASKLSKIGPSWYSRSSKHYENTNPGF